MASRYYSSVAAVTTLSNGVSPSGTSFIVGSTSGFPVQTPFTLLIDEGTTSEEIVTVTNVAGTTLTVTRGEDGTVAVAHDPGARVRHAMTARDLRESREHEAATTNVHGVASTAALVTSTQLSAHTSASTGVHGVSGSVVGTSGTQTLTGKTLSGASNAFSNIPQSAVAGLADAWVPFTPSWTAGGANPTIGNGTISAAYNKVGKTVDFRITITMGSTTAYGSGGWIVSMPEPFASGDREVFNGVAYDASSAQRHGLMFARSGNLLAIYTASSPANGVNPTIPMTWASGDYFSVSGTYECA